jgi:putative Ca2+/H+ antiporter (TMEM165/GDT1 family)
MGQEGKHIIYGTFSKEFLAELGQDSQVSKMGASPTHTTIRAGGAISHYGTVDQALI